MAGPSPQPAAPGSSEENAHITSASTGAHGRLPAQLIALRRPLLHCTPPGSPKSSQILAPPFHRCAGVLVLLVIIWTLGGHRVVARTQYLTEGSAACLLGLATGLVLLAARAGGGGGAALADRLLEFNAGSFFT